jgi:hypothetical protein
MSKKGPPGWAPHRIDHRVDGWITDPENENHIPISVARLIAEALPPLGGRDAIAIIRARMQARQHEYDRKKNVRIARERIFEGVKELPDE